LVFAVNDFDETLPGPLEWDVKRLAASITDAGRASGLTKQQARRATRSAMRGFAKRSMMVSSRPFATSERCPAEAPCSARAAERYE
jgi:uncharacterized protein (DUF2252 family)